MLPLVTLISPSPNSSTKDAVGLTSIVNREQLSSFVKSLSLQSSAVEQVLDILMDILSWPGNSRGGFPLPSSQYVITYCDQSFPSPWHCLSAAPSLSGATLLSTLEGVPLFATRGRRWSRSAQPSANLSHQQTPKSTLTNFYQH